MLKHRYLTISIIAILLAALIGQVYAATSPTLTDAGSFSVMGGETVTNTGPSTIEGDVGVYPGSATTGLSEATIGGTIYKGNAHALAAKSDFANAYDDIDQTCTVTYAVDTDLSGANLVPGVYCAPNFTLTGTLTLNGTADQVWIFKSAGTLITSGEANVVGGGPCNVWWRVVSSATLGTNTSLIGNILAQTSASLLTGASLDGRVFAETGAVTLDTNTIDGATCLTDSTYVAPTARPSRTAVPGDGVTGLPAFPGTGSGAPIFNEVSPWSLLIIAGILAIALLVGGRSLRRKERSK